MVQGLKLEACRAWSFSIGKKTLHDPSNMPQCVYASVSPASARFPEPRSQDGAVKRIRLKWASGEAGHTIMSMKRHACLSRAGHIGTFT